MYMRYFNRPRRMSQKLREILEKVLYKSYRFSWGKKVQIMDFI